MTNWFKKLRIDEREIVNYFNKEFGFVTWHAMSDNNFAVSVLRKGSTGKREDDIVYFNITPFYIKKMFTKQPTSPIDKYMSTNNKDEIWTSSNRISLNDFSSTPPSYYDIFLTRCNGEEKSQYLNELKEAYIECLNEEIDLLKKRKDAVDTDFNKEIRSRQKLLNVIAFDKFKAAGKKSNSKQDIANENNDGDVENE